MLAVLASSAQKAWGKCSNFQVYLCWDIRCMRRCCGISCLMLYSSTNIMVVLVSRCRIRATAKYLIPAKVLDFSISQVEERLFVLKASLSFVSVKVPK